MVRFKKKRHGVHKIHFGFYQEDSEEPKKRKYVHHRKKAATEVSMVTPHVNSTTFAIHNLSFMKNWKKMKHSERMMYVFGILSLVLIIGLVVALVLGRKTSSSSPPTPPPPNPPEPETEISGVAWGTAGFLIFLVIMAFVGSIWYYFRTKRKLKSLTVFPEVNKELEDANAKIKELEKLSGNTSATIDTLNAAIGDGQKRINQLNDALEAQGKGDYVVLRKEADELRNQIRKLEEARDNGGGGGGGEGGGGGSEEIKRLKEELEVLRKASGSGEAELIRQLNEANANLRKLQDIKAELDTLKNTLSGDVRAQLENIVILTREKERLERLLIQNGISPFNMVGLTGRELDDIQLESDLKGSELEGMSDELFQKYEKLPDGPEKKEAYSKFLEAQREAEGEKLKSAAVHASPEYQAEKALQFNKYRSDNEVKFKAALDLILKNIPKSDWTPIGTEFPEMKPFFDELSRLDTTKRIKNNTSGFDLTKFSQSYTQWPVLYVMAFLSLVPEKGFLAKEGKLLVSDMFSYIKGLPKLAETKKLNENDPVLIFKRLKEAKIEEDKIIDKSLDKYRKIKDAKIKKIEPGYIDEVKADHVLKDKQIARLVRVFDKQSDKKQTDGPDVQTLSELSFSTGKGSNIVKPKPIEVSSSLPDSFYKGELIQAFYGVNLVIKKMESMDAKKINTDERKTGIKNWKTFQVDLMREVNKRGDEGQPPEANKEGAKWRREKFIQNAKNAVPKALSAKLRDLKGVARNTFEENDQPEYIEMINRKTAVSEKVKEELGLDTGGGGGPDGKDESGGKPKGQNEPKDKGGGKDESGGKPKDQNEPKGKGGPGGPQGGKINQDQKKRMAQLLGSRPPPPLGSRPPPPEQ